MNDDQNVQNPVARLDLHDIYRACRKATGMTHQLQTDGPPGLEHAVKDRDGEVVGWFRYLSDARFAAIFLPAHRVNEEAAELERDYCRELDEREARDEQMRWEEKSRQAKRAAILLLHEAGMSPDAITSVIGDGGTVVGPFLQANGLEPLVTCQGRAAEAMEKEIPDCWKPGMEEALNSFPS